MIQLLHDRRESRFQICKIEDPAEILIHGPADMDFDAEGMTMQTGALVVRRHVRQPVRRLYLKNFENFHICVTRKRSCVYALLY